MPKAFYVYILKCSDGSYYTGLAANLEQRLHDHNEGLDPKIYTFSRRPVELVWSRLFPSKSQALQRERQIKGWSRAKKEALIAGDWDVLKRLSEGLS